MEMNPLKEYLILAYETPRLHIPLPSVPNINKIENVEREGKQAIKIENFVIAEYQLIHFIAKDEFLYRLVGVSVR